MFSGRAADFPTWRDRAITLFDFLRISAVFGLAFVSAPRLGVDSPVSAEASPESADDSDGDKRAARLLPLPEGAPAMRFRPNLPLSSRQTNRPRGFRRSCGLLRGLCSVPPCRSALSPTFALAGEILRDRARKIYQAFWLYPVESQTPPPPFRPLFLFFHCIPPVVQSRRGMPQFGFP
jgi:hypothetical protein